MSESSVADLCARFFLGEDGYNTYNKQQESDTPWVAFGRLLGGRVPGLVHVLGAGAGNFLDKNPDLKVVLQDKLFRLIQEQTGIPAEKAKTLFVSAEEEKKSRKAIRKLTKTMPNKESIRAGAYESWKNDNPTIFNVLTSVTDKTYRALVNSKYPANTTQTQTAVRNAAVEAACKPLLSYYARKIRSNPQETLDKLQYILVDGKGNIPESVQESPLLKPFVKQLRGLVPDEIKKSMPENEIFSFAFNTLRRMASREEGRESIAHLLENLDVVSLLPEIKEEDKLDIPSLIHGKKQEQETQQQAQPEASAATEAQPSAQPEAQTSAPAKAQPSAQPKVPQQPLEDDNAPLTDPQWLQLLNDARGLKRKSNNSLTREEWQRTRFNGQDNPPGTPAWEHKNGNGNSVLTLLGQEAGQEFFLNPKWKKYYPAFRDQVFNKDEKGRLTFKDNVNPDIKKLMFSIQECLLPKEAQKGQSGGSEYFNGSAIGLTTSLLDNLLSNANKREIVATFLEAPEKRENINLMARAVQGALADELGKDHHRTLRLMKETLFEDKDGGYTIRESVKDSPVLGPIVQQIQSYIPEEVQGTLREEQINKFAFLTFAAMNTTPDGRKQVTDFMRKDFTQQQKPDGRLSELCGRAALQTLSFKWDEFQPSFTALKGRILEKDASGTVVLRKDLSPVVKDLITNLQQQIPPEVSKYVDQGDQLGLAVSLFENLMPHCSGQSESGHALRQYLADPRDPEKMKALAQPIKETLAGTLKSSPALLATILNKQTGISAEVLEKEVFPLAQPVIEGVPTQNIQKSMDEKDPTAVITGVFAGLGDTCERDYQGTLNTLNHTFFDKNGNIPVAVEKSPLLGPYVKELREAIPEEISKSISEGHLSQFTFATLAKVGETPEGRALVADFVRGLGPKVDPFTLLNAKNKDGKSLATMLQKAASQEFLANGKWEKDYNKLKDAIFEKDSEGRLVLKKKTSPIIKEAISVIKSEVNKVFGGLEEGGGPSLDDGSQMRIAFGVFQKILEDPKKREGIIPSISDPDNKKNKQALMETMKFAVADFLGSDENKKFIAGRVKEIFTKNETDTAKAESEAFQKDVSDFATSASNILLQKDILSGVADGLKFDQEGNISDATGALKHLKDRVLTGLETGQTNADAKTVVDVLLRQTNILGLSDKLNTGLADALTKKEAAPILRQILPDDLLAKDAGPETQKKFLELLQTPEGQKQVTSVLTPEFRCALASHFISKQTGMTSQYTDPLAQFMSDDERFKKVLGVIGKSEIEDGSLKNTGYLVTTAIPSMLNTESDRKAFAQAITPTVCAPLGIPYSKETISPFAVALTHALSCESRDEFMERPVIGADNKKYSNISDYLAGKEMQAEFSRLEGNKDFKEVLTSAWSRQWEKVLDGVFPDEKAFKAYKETVAQSPEKALLTESQGGPIKKEWRDMIIGSIWGKGWNPLMGIPCAIHSLWLGASIDKDKLQSDFKSGEAVKMNTEVLTEEKEKASNDNASPAQTKTAQKEPTTAGLSGKLSQSQATASQPAKTEQPSGGISGRLAQAETQSPNQAPTPQKPEPQKNISLATMKKLTDNANC